MFTKIVVTEGNSSYLLT